MDYGVLYGDLILVLGNFMFYLLQGDYGRIRGYWGIRAHYLGFRLVGKKGMSNRGVLFPYSLLTTST